jgi:hypothetical protein
VEFVVILVQVLSEEEKDVGVLVVLVVEQMVVEVVEEQLVEQLVVGEQNVVQALLFLLFVELQLDEEVGEEMIFVALKHLELVLELEQAVVVLMEEGIVVEVDFEERGTHIPCNHVDLKK